MPRHILFVVCAPWARSNGEGSEHAQIVGKAAWEDLQAYSWEYLPLINAGHYIANYAWNDHVKGLNNYSGLYFWNVGYVE